MTISDIKAADQVITCQRLLTLLSLAEIERLMAKRSLLLPMQPSILGLSPQDRADKLLQVLVGTEGERLFADYEIRAVVAKSLGVTLLRKWIPGSFGAMSFIKRCGFPRPYAGKAGFGAPEPVVRYSPAPKVPTLLRFQETVVDDCLSVFRTQTKLLMSLPTGAGKTRCAAELIKKLSDTHSGCCRIVWLAHTEELCEQAISSLMHVCQSSSPNKPWYFLRMWGGVSKLKSIDKAYSFYEEPNFFDNVYIFVSTPLTCKRILASGMESPLKDELEQADILVIDEAHRAAAKTYREIIDLFENKKRDIKLIGLSATPVRENYGFNPFDGTKELINIFRVLVELKVPSGSDLNPTQFLISEGVLAQVEIKHVTWDIEPSCTAKNITKLLTDESTPSIAFVRSVADCKLLAFELRKRGVRAEYVSADNTPQERAAIIHALRNKTLDILLNCEILTTGFDAPVIKSAFILRSTKSPILYKQMLGRVMRGARFGGTSSAVVYLVNCNLSFPEDPTQAEFARTLWISEH